MKNIFDKFDNDTLIIIGLIFIASVYAFSETSEAINVVNSIVSGFIGYIGGQYIATKKEN